MKQDIKGHYFIKRALEIAAVGNHSIMLYGPRNIGKHTLSSAFPEVENIKVCDTCACGNYGSVLAECRCNQTRRERWTRRLTRMAQECDMVVEVAELPFRDWFVTPLSDEENLITQRIVKSKEFGKLNKSLQLDDPCYRTLEMAVRRLGLSYGTGQRILSVSRTIANLDQSERLKAKHIAEAIQYKTSGLERRI